MLKKKVAEGLQTFWVQNKPHPNVVDNNVSRQTAERKCFRV